MKMLGVAFNVALAAVGVIGDKMKAALCPTNSRRRYF